MDGVRPAAGARPDDIVRRTTPAMQRLFLATVALARYGEEVDWDQPEGWLYVMFLASVLALGLYGWRKSSE